MWTHLRHRGKKYNRRGDKTAGRDMIPNRVDISQHPEIVEKKSRVDDWEGDLIIGKNNQGAIMSHANRKSKYTKLALLPDKQMESVQKACRQFLMMPRFNDDDISEGTLTKQILEESREVDDFSPYWLFFHFLSITILALTGGGVYFDLL